MQPPSASPNRVLITVQLDAFQPPLPVVPVVPAVLQAKAVARCEPSLVGTSP
jgi:hypothetical protein